MNPEDCLTKRVINHPSAQGFRTSHSGWLTSKAGNGRRNCYGWKESLMLREKMKPLVGVLLGDALTPTKAASIADRYSQCPYCVCYTSAGCMVIGVFSLPSDHRWWLEWVAENSEGTLGLKYAEVFFTQGVEASSSWARGEVRPNLKQAPCGADCPECSKYREACDGCPATHNYVGS